jgi:ferric-dicitrate binding protein FerR (iron transport regulator)
MSNPETLNIDRNDWPELFEKFVDGTCTPEEEMLIKHYLKNPDNDHQVSLLMNKLWNTESRHIHNGNKKQSQLRYDRLRASITGVRTENKWLAYKIAASFLLLISALLTAYTQWDKMVNYIDPVTYITQKASAGQRMEIQLPDGTVVWLNASSAITYPEEFREDTRTLKLTGEAFFEVKKDALKPFIVRTENLFTKVLGTSFNIKAYAGQNKLEVTVATGKVAVGEMADSTDTGKELASLTPHQRFTYFFKSTEFVKEDSVQIDASKAWVDGKLVFNTATLEEVVQALQRWYDVRITIMAEEKITCTFTANFKDRTPLTDVLEALSLTHKMKYSLEGKSVTIRALESCEQ